MGLSSAVMLVDAGPAGACSYSEPRGSFGVDVPAVWASVETAYTSDVLSIDGDQIELATRVVGKGIPKNRLTNPWRPIRACMGEGNYREVFTPGDVVSVSIVGNDLRIDHEP